MSEIPLDSGRKQQQVQHKQTKTKNNNNQNNKIWNTTFHDIFITPQV